LPVGPTLVIAAGLFVGSLAAMAALAGWDPVVRQLHPLPSPWFAVALAAEVASFAGYVFAYRSVAHIEGGPRIGWRRAAELVSVGFGAFIVSGGGKLDSRAMRGRGTKGDGEVRVLTLDALEHAPLAPAACAAAIDLLVEGQRKPGLDFSIPWAAMVPIGAIAAFVGVRHRDRFVGKKGWRGALGQALEGIRLLFRLAGEWRRHWPAFVGAGVYWLGDVACLWASLKPFGATPTLPAIVIAHAVGYTLTRRTLPFAGAGIVEVLMPLTLVAAGAPFPGAVLGVISYRIFNLWLPLIPAFVARPAVRRSLGFDPATATPRS
jgi:uncharacterized membrane protein YbhN (UPF0104 family)